MKFVGGGPAPADLQRKAKIQEAFGDYGQILRIETPQGKGLAYLEFDDKRDAEDMVSDTKGHTFQYNIIIP